MRSVRFQVILFTTLLVISGNVFLAMYFVGQGTETLVAEKYEKLSLYAHYLDKMYTEIVDVNIRSDADRQFRAQRGDPQEFRSMQEIYADMRSSRLDIALRIYTAPILNISEVMGTGFYFSDLDQILGFKSNPANFDHEKMVYAVPIHPEGSFLWVEESNHHIDLMVRELSKQTGDVTLVVILITLLIAGAFALSFSSRLKKILKTLDQLRTNIHSNVPALSGEFGHITAGIRSLADAVIQTRSRSELILNSAHTGMIAFDSSMAIVLMNDSASNHLECNGQKLMPNEILDRLGHLISTSVKQAFDTGNSYSFDGIRKMVENKEKFFNVNIIPSLHSPDHKMVLVTLEDVTENVKLIKEAEKNESLKMLGLFTTGVAHEIRNPLTSIKGFIQLLNRKMKDQGDNARLLHLVLREIERLENLIKDLITYARPSRPNFEWVPIMPLLDTIIQVLMPRIAQKKAKLEMQNLEDLELFIDRRQMYQVFFNLMLNAIQAVAYQDGLITLKADIHEQYVDLIVQDNGRGIEKTEFGKIFTPFYTTKDKGTGLGLAISRRMVDDHEGKIFFDSSFGKGTQFAIRFFKFRIRKSVGLDSFPK